jgi:hypothetical protein
MTWTSKKKRKKPTACIIGSTSKKGFLKKGNVKNALKNK